MVRAKDNGFTALVVEKLARTRTLGTDRFTFSTASATAVLNVAPDSQNNRISARVRSVAFSVKSFPSASWTRRRVFCRTPGRLLTTRSTVADPTFAARAISRMVGPRHLDLSKLSSNDGLKLFAANRALKV